MSSGNFERRHSEFVTQTRTIAELCKEYRHAIDDIKIKNSEYGNLDADQFRDDLFILRFLLSHKGDIEKASEAYITTCKWRHEHRELLASMRAGAQPPFQDVVGQYNISQQHKTTKDGWPVYIGRVGISNIRRMMDDLSADQVFDNFTFSKEAVYHCCDVESRRQGKIVKVISVIDFKHASFSNLNDTRFFNVMGRSTKETELLYPQLLHISVMMNMPFWFRALAAVGKLFMSQSTLEKIKFCYGKTLKEPLTNCPYASTAFRDEDLPTFLGGKCTCTDGRCVGGISNDQKQIVMYQEEEQEEED